MAEKFVLQNENTGTIHQIIRGRQTYCGAGKNSKDYKRRSVRVARQHPKVKYCQGKCKAHH